MIFPLDNKKILGLFLALSLLIFSNSLTGNFVYDDQWVISRNPTIAQPSSLIRQFVRPYHHLQPETGLYRPLTMVSYVANRMISAKPLGFHLFNIGLHAANTFLVFMFIGRMFRRQALAWGVSLLFLALPIHVEAVAAISGRPDLLATFFSLICLWYAYGRRYRRASAMFLLAVFSKESALALVPLLALMAWWREGTVRTAIRSLTAFGLSGALYVGLRYAALGRNFLSNDADFVYNPLKYADSVTRLATGLKVMVLYLTKTFWPTHLSADYSFDQIRLVHTFLDPWVLAGAALLVLFLVLAAWKRTRLAPLGFGAMLFLASYLIISNFAFPIGTIMAERAFYMPSAGLLLVVVAAILKVERERYRRWFTAGLFVLLIGYAPLTFARNRVWHDTETLFTDMVSQSPQSVHAKTNLGIYYIQTGQRQNNEALWQKGKVLLEESYAVAPEHLPTIDSLGIVAEHGHRYQDAERFYQRALELRPFYATAMSNLGRLYFSQGRYQEAGDIYLKQFNYHPAAGLMLVYAMSRSKLGNYDAAVQAITSHYGEMPSDLNLQFALGYAYYKKGDKVKADVYFKNSKNPNISDEEFLRSIQQF